MLLFKTLPEGRYSVWQIPFVTSCRFAYRLSRSHLRSCNTRFGAAAGSDKRHWLNKIMALYKVRCNFSGESSQFSFLAAVPTFRPLALEDHHAIADALNWYPYRLATCVYWINCLSVHWLSLNIVVLLGPHVPCYNMCPVLLDNIFAHYLIKGTISPPKVFERKMCFEFL